MTVWRDPSLPHQIVLNFIGQAIGVSCNCMRGVGSGNGYEYFEMRSRWDDPGEPMRIWRAHMAKARESRREVSRALHTQL